MTNHNINQNNKFDGSMSLKTESTFVPVNGNFNFN